MLTSAVVVASALVASSVAYSTPPQYGSSIPAYGSSSVVIPSRPVYSTAVSSSAYSSSATPTSTRRSSASSTPAASPTSSAVSSAIPSPANNWLNWRTFKANGANLGGWLEKEKTHDPLWWDAIGGYDAPDEWTLCQVLGASCGPILESRYQTFINTSTIDLLASVGVNTLRIPTTYAAWVDVPGSAFWHGNQVAHLRRITDYAIRTYGMHCIIGLHSLPGGVNNLDIGEALFHDDWFYNLTSLDYSFQAIDRMLEFVTRSGYPQAFTIAPLNEASDNLTLFGSPGGLSQRAVRWVNRYHYGVLDRIARVDPRIPMMIQDNFKGADFWADYYEENENIVMDSHVYYFAAAGTYANYVSLAVCGQALYIAEQTKFPNFIGEWALQTLYNNTLAARKQIFDIQRYAWMEYVSGGAFWTAVSYSTALVDGEGMQRDYWSYTDLINAGVITNVTGEAFC